MAIKTAKESFLKRVGNFSRKPLIFLLAFYVLAYLLSYFFLNVIKAPADAEQTTPIVDGLMYFRSGMNIFLLVFLVSVIALTFYFEKVRSAKKNTELSFFRFAIKLFFNLIIGFGIISFYLNYAIDSSLEKKMSKYDTDSLKISIEENSETKPEEIVSFLKKTGSCVPLMLGSQEVSKKFIIADYKEKEELSEYAINIVLPNMEIDKFPEINFDPPAFVYQDKLYITSIDYQDQSELDALDQISPLIAQSLVSCYFSNKNIPLIANLKNHQSKEYTESEIKRHEEKIVEYNLKINQIDKKSNPSQIDLKNKVILTENIASRKRSIRTLDGKMLGYFNKPSRINLMHQGKQNSNPPRYIVTLIHEYVHFIAYKKGVTKFLQRAMSDGITDYYTVKIIEKSGRVYKGGSYPQPIRVITEMMKDIPEEKILDFVFEANQEKIEGFVDDAYGANFYEKHREIFESIIYDRDNAKEHADSIIKDIEAARAK